MITRNASDLLRSAKNRFLAIRSIIVNAYLL